MMNKDLHTSIFSDLKVLEESLVSYLITPNEPTNQILKHIFASGGKRIRPSIFLLFSCLFAYEGEHKYSIAAVCEYIHTASLLHDDVIDNSKLRRNKPTVNSFWGDETAILVGDLIYSAACRLMVRTKNLALIDMFAECIRFMSESELFQLELLWQLNTTEADYLRVVAGKTASLFEASAKSVGFLTDSDEKTIEQLSGYGKNIGFAFQIFDDCLDYDSKESEIGKPIISDLTEGKVTLPLIYALQIDFPEKSEMRSLVDAIVESGRASTQEKESLIFFIKKSGALDLALLQANNYMKKAQGFLEKIEPFYNKTELQKTALNALKQLSFFVLTRKS